MRSKEGFWLVIGAIVVVGLIALFGCEQKSTLSQSTTNLSLLDVSSAGAYKNSRTGESYWQMANTDVIVRCYHSRHWWTGLTSTPYDCEQFTIPQPQLPATAELLALNMGVGQKTQSVWRIDSSGAMKICIHNKDFWSATTSSVERCDQFVAPPDMPAALLASMNSGRGVAAQSFWIKRDGSLASCTHEKDANGFLGLGANSIGKIASCSPMDKPTAMFPSEYGEARLVGVTSDSSRPWETFWQDSGGTVVRCKYSNAGGILQDDYLGSAQSCGYWQVPGSADLPFGR